MPHTTALRNEVTRAYEACGGERKRSRPKSDGGGADDDDGASAPCVASSTRPVSGAPSTAAKRTALLGSARHIRPSSGCGGIGKKLASMNANSASHHSAWGCAALAIVQS